MRKIRVVGVGLLLAGCASAPLTVDHTNPKAFQTVQAAIDALPEAGGEIVLAPGTYREKINTAKNGVHIKGTGKAPSDVVIVWDDGASTAGGTFKSSTFIASGDDFHLDNLTVKNAYWDNPANKPSQAVALSVTGDRGVFTRVRLLGAQDTLYANKNGKKGEGRQFYSDCYIEGHVDFIFGNANAYFQNCELHGIAAGSVMYTAQSKNSPEERSAYVFDNCKLTADPGAKEISLGRAWRPYATVIFLNTDMQANVIPGGWREWTPGKTDTLKTATYAEYKSTGPGANPSAREPYSKQLNDQEAAQWALKAFFKDDLGWLPASAK
jgi:pectinesterase